MKQEEKTIDEIENLPMNTGRKNVNNDHALSDVHRENQYASATSALEKEKTKRRSKPLLVLLSILLVAALSSAATVVVYKMYAETPTTSAPTGVTSQPAQPTTATTLDAKTVLATITTGYAATNDMPMQPIKVAGYDYYVTVSPPGAAAKKDVAYSQSSVETAAIAKQLKELGFAEKKIQDGDGDAMLIINYTHQDVICRVTVTKTANNPTGNHLVQVGCENMARIKAKSEAFKPYYALLPSTIKIGQLAMSGDPTKVVASKTPGYATLDLGVSGVTDQGEYGMGGSAQLFYQMPDKSWHYFTGTQNILPCTSFSTPDLKKAYLGHGCYDTATNNEKATVAL